MCCASTPQIKTLLNLTYVLNKRRWSVALRSLPWVACALPDSMCIFHFSIFGEVHDNFGTIFSDFFFYPNVLFTQFISSPDSLLVLVLFLKMGVLNHRNIDYCFRKLMSSLVRLRSLCEKIASLPLYLKNKLKKHFPACIRFVWSGFVPPSTIFCFEFEIWDLSIGQNAFRKQNAARRTANCNSNSKNFVACDFFHFFRVTYIVLYWSPFLPGFATTGSHGLSDILCPCGSVEFPIGYATRE